MGDFQQLLIVSLIAFYCSTLQSVVGFGYGLFSVPLLLMAGLDLPEAVLITIVASALQRIVAVTKLRKFVDWRTVLPMAATAILLLPVGLQIMKYLSGQEKDFVKQVIGVLILVVIVVQKVFRIEPREKLHAAWGFLAAVLSGILQGLANIGGPPVILWIYAHAGWPNEKLRVTQVAISVPLVPFQIALIIAAYSYAEMAPAISLGIVSVIPVLLGLVVGLSVGRKVPVEWLRKGAYALLALLCILAIFGPLIKG